MLPDILASSASTSTGGPCPSSHASHPAQSPAGHQQHPPLYQPHPGLEPYPPPPPYSTLPRPVHNHHHHQRRQTQPFPYHLYSPHYLTTSPLSSPFSSTTAASYPRRCRRRGAPIVGRERQRKPLPFSSLKHLTLTFFTVLGLIITFLGVYLLSLIIIALGITFILFSLISFKLFPTSSSSTSSSPSSTSSPTILVDSPPSYQEATATGLRLAQTSLTATSASLTTTVRAQEATSQCSSQVSNDVQLTSLRTTAPMSPSQVTFVTIIEATI